MKGLPIIRAAVLSAAAFAFGASAAGAATMDFITGPNVGGCITGSDKCVAAKIKCTAKYADSVLKCHIKAEGKGIPADDKGCISAKAEPKYADCMTKAALKIPCITVTPADTAIAKGKSDAFTEDVVSELDPGYVNITTASTLNKCSAAKKKCVEKKMVGVIKCYEKFAAKSLGFDSAENLKLTACLAKAKSKFDGGTDPLKGCFTKAEAKPPCLTTGDSRTLEAKVDAYSLQIYSGFVAGFVSGQVTNASPTGAFVKNLSVAGLNIGGGGAVVGEGLIPDGSTNRWTSDACPAGLCALTSTATAPAANSAQPDCTAVGCNFGPPLPIPNAATPALTTCVLNTFASPSTGVVDLPTGAAAINVNLSSDVYLTGNLSQPCPICQVNVQGQPAAGTPVSPITGTCDRGPNTGGACTSTNLLGLSRDCQTGGVAVGKPCTPGGGLCVDGSHVGPIGVNLSPLVTGVVTKAKANGLFTTGQTSVGCFGQPSCRQFDESGTEFGPNGGPIAPGVPACGRLASIFDIPATGNGLVDASAALPGPGAISLPGSLLLTP